MQVTRLITEDIACLHDYTLQVSQMQALENAQMVIKSGAGLEDFLEDITIAAPIIVDASHGVALQCGDDHHAHDHHHDVDPHYWLCPANAKIMANNISVALVDAYPEHASVIVENLKLLEKQISDLSDYADAQLKNLSCRELITFHDGFSYMADAFNMEILQAIAEESGSEASAQKLIALACLVEKHHLPAIFIEQNGSASSATIIAKETATTIFSLDMAMSGESYFDAMYHNIDTLKEALE